MLLSIIMLASGCLGSDNNPDDDGPQMEERSEELFVQGYADEGSIEEAVTVHIEEGDVLIDMRAVVTWMDEPDIQRVRTYYNSPDDFQLWLEDQDSFTETNIGTNYHGTEGSVFVEFPMDYYDEGQRKGPRDISVSVEITDAGDYYPRSGGGETDKIEDTGNDYNCWVTYRFITPKPD